jgi:hypothetical protein
MRALKIASDPPPDGDGTSDQLDLVEVDPAEPATRLAVEADLPTTLTCAAGFDPGSIAARPDACASTEPRRSTLRPRRQSLSASSR